MQLKLIKSIFVISIFTCSGISVAANSDCNYLLNFKNQEIVVKDKGEQYRVFNEAHEFLNKVVSRYELFSSNDFLANKFKDYVLRAVFASTKIELLKNKLNENLANFIGGDEFNKLTYNLLDQMKYLKANNEKFKLIERLSSENESLKTAKSNFDNARNEKKADGVINQLQEDMAAINKKITKTQQDLKNLDIRPIPVEDHVVATDFSYTINGEVLSSKNLPKMNDSIKIKLLLDEIEKDLKVILFKNISHLSDYETTDRINFLNQSKTFSYAEFIKSGGEKEKYYSISGMNFEFKKPSTQLKQKLQDKIRNNEYPLNKEALNERLHIIDTLLQDNIIMVNQFGKNYIPAINTKRRNSDLNKNDLANTQEFEIFEKLPINQGKKKADMIEEFYDLKNMQELGEETLKKFKTDQFILEKDARIADSEYKLLNQFLDRTIEVPNIIGELNVYTSKPACNSCITGYESFKEQRPNVSLNVITLIPKLETELKADYLTRHQ